MEKEDTEKCCGENKILAGFKFGIGVYLAFLAGTTILIILTVLFFYILRAAGISF